MKASSIEEKITENKLLLSTELGQKSLTSNYIRSPTLCLQVCCFVTEIVLFCKQPGRDCDIKAARSLLHIKNS